MNQKIIRSKDFKQIDVEWVEVLVDPDTGPTIGLKIDPVKGKPFIMPLDVDCARQLCRTLVKTLVGLSEF